MKVKMYPLIEQIVEQGIDAGYLRAHKHVDKHWIGQYIMNGFDEAFEFDKEE